MPKGLKWSKQEDKLLLMVENTKQLLEFCKAYNRTENAARVRKSQLNRHVNRRKKMAETQAYKKGCPFDKPSMEHCLNCPRDDCHYMGHYTDDVNPSDYVDMVDGIREVPRKVRKNVAHRRIF